MGSPLVSVVPGQRYGRLVCVKEVEPRISPNGTRVRLVLCHCECGAIKIARLSTLRRGETSSCGCYEREVRSRNRDRTTHGQSGSLTFHTWDAILQRCCNPRSKDYPRYGGVGITVCDRWRNSFEAFLEDMGERPSARHSIDRYPDQNGPYAPGNCRWATSKEQNRNRRTNVILTFRGESRCVVEWAELTEIPASAIYQRIRYGWQTKRILTTPSRKGAKP